MVIGSKAPININPKEINKRLESSFTKQHYARGQVPIDSVTNYVLKRVKVLQDGKTNASANVNRDMWPRDEYNLGRF